MGINRFNGFRAAVGCIIFVGLFSADIECWNNSIVVLNQIDYLKYVHIPSGQVFGQRIGYNPEFYGSMFLPPCTSAGTDKENRRLRQGLAILTASRIISLSGKSL